MVKYFIAVSITGPDNYFQFMNFEEEHEGFISSMDDIANIEEEIRNDLIENGIIPEKEAYMFNINVINWKKFDDGRRKQI